MSFLWKCLKKFTCKSSCQFNNQEFDCEMLNRRMIDYKLKNKDLEKIIKILSKRELKNLNIIKSDV